MFTVYMRLAAHYRDLDQPGLVSYYEELARGV